MKIDEMHALKWTATGKQRACEAAMMEEEMEVVTVMAHSP